MPEPRVVCITRPTEFEQLRGTYGTVAQAEFYTNAAASSTYNRRSQTRKGTQDVLIASASRYGMTSTSQEAGASTLNSSNPYVAQLENEHNVFTTYKNYIMSSIPDEWRTANCPREFLDRFVFEPDDIIFVIGQDGLVANVAKYLKHEQIVIGFNVDPNKNPGNLVPFATRQVNDVIAALKANTLPYQRRFLVQATLDNGQAVVGLNEIFIGHRSHQSSRYELNYGTAVENQSSSGIIVATGSGMTGWCSSIIHQRDQARLRSVKLPSPTDNFYVFMVREAWKSPFSGDDVTEGNVGPGWMDLLITSEMEEGGTIFADGIEADHQDFAYGAMIDIDPAPQQLLLAQP